MDICLNEIRHCRQISPRPNFLILAGQRYGWIPLPDRLTETAVRSVISYSAERGRELLNAFYFRDFNSIEPTYCLIDGAEFSPHAAECRAFFDEYGLHDTAFAAKYLLSATEREIYEGLFSEPELKENVALYMRRLSDIPLDKTEIYSQGESRQTRLQKRLAEYVPARSIFQADLRFDDYIRGNTDQFFTDGMISLLTELVTEEMDAHERLDVYAEELMVQRVETETCMSNYPLLCGNADSVLAAVDTHGIVLVDGSPANDSGAMMSHIAATVPECIIRHAGISQLSGSIDGLLRSIYNELTGEIVDPGSISELCLQMRRLFARQEKRLLIILTNVDRLPEDFGLFASMWFPAYGSNVRLLISAEDYPVSLKSDRKDLCRLQLPRLDSEAMKKVVLSRLEQMGRKITGEQQAVADRIMGNADSFIPQSVDMAVHCLSQLKSVDSIAQGNSFPAYFWHEVCSPKNNQPLFARLALALICSIRGGVTDKELVEILALDEELFCAINGANGHRIVTDGMVPSIPTSMWSKLYFQIVPVISASTGVSAAKNSIAYLAASQSLKSFLSPETCNRVLLLAKSYFSSPMLANTPRAVELLPDIMLKLHDYDGAATLLSDDTFCNRKIAYGMFAGLVRDIREVLGRLDSEVLKERLYFLLSEEPTLCKYCIHSPRFFGRELNNFKARTRKSVGKFVVNMRRLMRFTTGMVVAYNAGKLLVVENLEDTAVCTVYSISDIQPKAAVELPLKRITLSRNGEEIDSFYSEVKEAVLSDDGTVAGMTCVMGMVVKWNIATAEVKLLDVKGRNGLDAYCSSPVMAGERLVYSVSQYWDIGDEIRMDDEVIFDDPRGNHYQNLYLSSDGSKIYALSSMYLEYQEISLAAKTAVYRKVEDPDLHDWIRILGYDRQSDSLFYRPDESFGPVGILNMAKQTARSAGGTFQPKDYIFSVWSSGSIEVIVAAAGESGTQLWLWGKNSGNVYGHFNTSDSSRVRLIPVNVTSFLCVGKDIQLCNLTLASKDAAENEQYGGLEGFI